MRIFGVCVNIVLLLMAALSNRAVAAEPAANLLETNQRHPKALQLSVEGFGGSYLGASVGSTGIAGTRALLYVTRTLGVGAMYGYSALGSGHDFGAVPRKTIHIANGHLEVGVDAALRITESFTLEIDLYGLVGGGAMRIADTWEPAALLGGGLRAYTGIPWLAVRIDVLNFMHRSQRDDGSSFESDVAFTIGLAFLLPPKP